MNRDSQIKGKTIVITGASGGLGKEIATECAKKGADLFILARRTGKLRTIAGEIERDYKVRCTAIKLDVEDADDIQKVFQFIYNQVGEIDVLVNNAGFGMFAEAENTTAEEIKRIFDVNVLGLVNCSKMVIPYMKSSKFGHIINIASQAGKLATPKSSIYAASKHAVLGYTNSLRMELASFGIYVTAVNPGPIRTSFFDHTDPQGKYLEKLGRTVLEPSYVAEKVVKVMCTSKREVNLPWWMNVAALLHTLMPGVVEKVGKNAFHKK